MMASHPSKMLLAIIYMEFPYGQGNERNYFPKITLIYTIRKKYILILCGENHCSSITNCSNSEINLYYLGLVFQFYIALN